MPEVFDHFFRLLGTTADEQLDLVRLDPAYRVFFEGDAGAARRALRPDGGERPPSSGSSPAPARRLEAYLDSAREAYDLAVRRFLYTTYQTLLPLLRPDVLRRAPPAASAAGPAARPLVGGAFTDPRLRQMLGYPAVFLGTSPYRAPSMYHLMSHLDLDDGVLYPRGGFARFVDSLVSLAQAEGVRIRTGATATQVVTERSRPGSRWQPAR